MPAAVSASFRLSGDRQVGSRRAPTAVLTERRVAHDRKSKAPDDPVRLRISNQGTLLLRSGLCVRPLPRQLAQAANHLLGPRGRHVVEAL